MTSPSGLRALTVIMARAMDDGVWHVAIRTYPADMDTACGKHLRATVFATKGHPNFMQRPACEECLMVPRE